MTLLAVQYLEAGPQVAAIPPERVRARLRAACERLPLTHVLIGWNVPQPTLDACREETHRAGAKLYRWHPLLTGDGTFFPRPAWRTLGLRGEPVPGFQDMPEFTFVCPNSPKARTAVLDRVRQVVGSGDYDGLFLDRIRYPSPAADPGRWLACFCGHCEQVAAQTGLDLAHQRQMLRELLGRPERWVPFLQVLLGSPDPVYLPIDLILLRAFLDFRARSVTGLVCEAADLIRAAGLEVGLDGFSPALTRMVGQDLSGLHRCAEWTKIMTYGHTLGPAGLPFELLALAQWVLSSQAVGPGAALAALSQASGLPLPTSLDDLKAPGLSPQALAAEIRRGRAAGIGQLLAGVELVEIEGITHLRPPQIAADLRALREAGADGLVLSWDLWHIPLDWLELVGRMWA
jgi:hypothetical protein